MPLEFRFSPEGSKARYRYTLVREQTDELTALLLPPLSLSVEQALQMSVDVVQKPDTGALTIEDFGVPKMFKLEECAISVVRRFRRVQHFGFVKGYH